MTSEHIEELALATKTAPARFSDLWSAIEARVRRQVEASIGRRFGNDIDDTVQAVAIKLFQRIGGFEQRAKFSTWLYGIVKFECMRAVSENLTRLEREESLYDSDGEPRQFVNREDDPASEMFTIELAAFINRLPENERRVVQMRQAGCDHDEIATMLRIAPGSSRVLLSRALARIRKFAGIDPPRRPKSKPTLPPATTAMPELKEPEVEVSCTNQPTYSA
jgi:RNA polymerase sigma factor (sigma-70 family)